MRREITSNELDALYREIGEGIWHLQHVEDVLNTLITLKVEVKTPGHVTHEEAQGLLARHRRNTFGVSLGIAKKNSVVPSSLEERLTHFKEERNWLVHRSLNTHGELLYTEEGRTQIFARLANFSVEAKALQFDITNEIALFAESQGINIVEAELRAHAKVARLKGQD